MSQRYLLIIEDIKELEGFATRRASILLIDSIKQIPIFEGTSPIEYKLEMEKMVLRMYGDDVKLSK
jgi:hypothetical protein